MVTLPDIRTRLQSHVPPEIPAPGSERRAAVAVILRAGNTADGGPEILFIRRAERNGDPWSGHMAFPGGHADPEDDSLAGTAMRETLEEIGLDLRAHGELIGRIAHTDAAPPSRPMGMLVAPYVFELHRTPAFELSDEVAGVVWTPLRPMVRGEQHGKQPRTGRVGFGHFPGYTITGEHFVWGLTYRMLHNFFEVVQPDWRPPQD